MIEQRPGWLLAYVGQITSDRLKKAMSEHGLKPSHCHVITLLFGRGPQSQQALLEEMGVDPSVLVHILNGLEGESLVERRRNPADRRRHIVELTPVGVELIEAVQVTVAAVEKELFADLRQEEIESLMALLSRVRTAPLACDGD